MSDTPITDAAITKHLHIHRQDGSAQLFLELVDAEIAKKLERELRWARGMLWETYWLAYDLQRSVDAYVDGYNDSEDKKRVKLAKTAFKKLDKKFKKEGEKFRRNKNPDT